LIFLDWAYILISPLPMDAGDSLLDAR